MMIHNLPSLFFLLISQLLAAQTFTELTPSPFEGVWLGAVAVSDVDGDGDPDVLITGEKETYEAVTHLYINDGSGGFSQVAGTPFQGVRSGAVVFSDVDGDGDADVFLSGANDQLEGLARLYINDGAGGFSEASGTSFEPVTESAAAFSDVDGDGDEDLLLTGQTDLQAVTRLYRNDGSGNFSEIPGTSFLGVSFGAVAFSDVDGDQDPDVLISGISFVAGPISLVYTNDGSGNFAPATSNPFPGLTNSAVAFSDVDGDGDPDVLLSGEASDFDPITRLYVNDGLGNFSEASGAPFEPVEKGSISFSDVDLDGDPDVFLTGELNAIDRLAKLFLNDGSGNFSAASTFPLDGVINSAAAFSDMNGDGYEDLLVTGLDNSFGYIAKLFLNDGLSSSLAADLSTGGFDFKLAPNPVGNDLLQVTFRKSGQYSLSIFNMAGQMVHSLPSRSFKKDQSATIDTSMLPEGAYVIQLNNGRLTSRGLFLVAR